MTAPTTDHRALFDSARALDIEAVAGVRLYRAGQRWRGPCPLCKSGARKKADGPFSVDRAQGFYKCFACDGRGDVVALEQVLRGGTAIEAAQRLVGGGLQARPAAPAVVRERKASKSGLDSVPNSASESGRAIEGQTSLAQRLWDQALAPPHRDDLKGLHPLRAYLTARGLAGAAMESALMRVRFAPRAFYGRDPFGEPMFLPAMVAQVVTESGPTGGVHLTYLDPQNGWAKTLIKPGKKMFGPQNDAQDRPGGVWLARPRAGRTLVVAEGIESALSAAQMQDRPCHVLAALSLNRLQGGWLGDKWGRKDPDLVRPDPDQPALTWDLGPGVIDEVLIAIDRDMSPIEVPVRGAGGKTVKVSLDGERRARICAGLAVAAWHARLGPGASVRAIAPPPGQDFNDALKNKNRLGEL